MMMDIFKMKRLGILQEAFCSEQQESKSFQAGTQRKFTRTVRRLF